MDITPELLRNNSEFRSLSPDKQTEVLESFAKDQRPELLQMFLEGSNRLMEEISRESGIGRVYVEKKVMESLKDVLPSDYNDLDDDAKVTAIDAALPKLEERVAELDPVNRNDTRFYAERILSQEQRRILGKEVGDVGDKTKRFVGGVIQSFAAPFDEEGTRNWLYRNLPTNPDYDQTTASQLTQAAGDFVGQIGQFAAIAALAAPSGGASVGLLGLRGGAGIAMGISTAQNASRKFQENYNLAVGEMGLSEDEALAAGIAGMPGAIIDSFGDALLLKGVKLGSASKAFSSMSAKEKAAEIVAKGSQVLKDPTFIRTASKNLFKGFLKEGLTESLGDAATAWGGYATSGHEGFKPSAESLWQSFWMGGVLGGAFSTIADTGGDMRNTRALRELGQIDQDQFVSMGQQAQEQVAALMDAENYAGALDVIKRFKAATKPSQAQQQPDQQEQAPEPDQPEQEQQQVVNPASKQEEMDDEELTNEYYRREDFFSGSLGKLKEAPENPQIAGVKAKILGALPNSLNAVRRALQISSEAGSQTTPATQRVTLGEVETAIDNIIAQRKNATKKGKQQQSNQQQPQDAPQGRQAPQASDSNSAQQGQANATPAPTPAEEVTPEVKAQKKAKVRKRAEKLAKTPVEAVSAPDVDQVTPEDENTATGQPEVIADQSEEITAEEATDAAEDIQELQDESEKASEKIKSKKPKSKKKKQDEEEEAPDATSDLRESVMKRIDNMVMLAKYKAAVNPQFRANIPAVESIAEKLRKKASGQNLIDIINTNEDLDNYATNGQMINKRDVDQIISILNERSKIPTQQQAAQEAIGNIQGAAQGGMLFQDEQGPPIIDNNPQYRMLSELNNRELSTAKGIIQALRRLGINEQVSDADKILALEIKQAVNSGSMSEELISKLNEAAPSRAVFQNQVNNLKGFGPTTKRVIMMHFDVMALNYLKTGESLAAFWAQVPQITVVDSIDAGARGALISGGLGDMSEVGDSQRSDFATVTDVALPASDGGVINIPFSPIPNRIVLVRGKYNASTLMHENDHNMIITGMAQRVVEAEDGGVDLWNEVLAELGMERNQPWTVEAHEKWARAREVWIRGGEVKSIFTRVFNALKAIFTNLYTSGALDKYKNPTLEKAFVKVFDINTAPVEDIKAKVARDTGYEASQLLAHIPANKLEKAQMIIESAKLIPDIGAAKAHIIATATTYENDQQAFTDDEVFAMVGMLERVYTGNQAPLGLPLYDEVQNHFDGVNSLNTYYGAARQKGKPRDITNPNTLYQDSAIETTSTQENVNRFNELTDSLYQGRDSVTQDEIDAWKAGNPEAWAELSQMREEVLREAGYVRKGVRFGFYVGGVPLPPAIGEQNFGPGYYVAEDAVLDTSASSVSVNPELNKRALDDLGLKEGDVTFRRDNVFVKAQSPLPSSLSETEKSLITAEIAYQSAVNDAYSSTGEYGYLAPEKISKLRNAPLLDSSIRTGKDFTNRQRAIALLIRDNKLPYDSIRGMTGRKGMSSELVVQRASQIKSADPISAGPKITPDQWADTRNPNILYQDSALETTDVIQQSITPNAGEVIYQSGDQSSFDDNTIRSAIGMGHAMIQMAARLGVQVNHTKIGKEIATLVNSQNNRSGKKLKEATIAKAANSLIKQFQEMHSNLQPKEQRNLVSTAYEKMFVIEDMGLDADSYARRNNIRKRKGQPIEEQRRLEVQEVVRGLYNTFKNARTNNYFKNKLEGFISPEFRVIADRIITLIDRGLDNVMGAFNSTNEDLLIRFADNIDAYQGKLYKSTPEFVEQFSNTITEVEDAVTQHLVSQFYALNSAYLDANGISKEIDALLAQLPPMPEETAMEHYERMVKIIQQVEAEMFKISSEGNPNEQSESGKRAAKVREKREEIARTHQRVLIEKFPTVEDFIAYKREKDGGLHTPEIEENLRENYEYATTENITELNDPALRDFNSVALTMIVGGSNTSFLNVSKRKWRREKVQSWHDLVDRMAFRVGNNSLVRAIHRGASRSNTLDRLANWFDSTFQSNVENFHVWIDRFSQYAPVRDWFENQFFKDFTTGVFTQAETARKTAEYWIQNDVIKAYNDDIDNTVQANPYLWVMSMLSQYNLGSDPNKGFAKAVTRAKTSIARTIKQGRSGNLVSEANRNRTALEYMLEGIDINADNSYDMFMAKAYNENRLGEGDPVKTQKRAELLSNISNYFQQDIANQKFIRENILGQPFVTVVNYLPLKAMKTDGSVDAWDWTNIEPKTERLVGATNVNARSNDERQETLGDDRAYGMDFFNMVERKAVKNALDRHAMLPVAVLADSFRTETKNIDGVSVSVPKDEAIKTIFGENPEVVGQLAIIKEKITHQMVQIYGVTEPPTEFVGGLKKMIGVVQGGMLSGIGQVVQQSTAAIVDYCGREAGNMAYMFDAMLYWSKNYEKVREWLRVNNPDIYERGNTQGILEFERHINNAGSELNSMLDKGWRGVDQIRKFMTISLRYGDKIGAELIFLAEHMKAVKQSGQTPFGGDYDINDYNNPAFTDRANGQIARFIGPSSAAGRSYWMSDHKQAYFLLRALTGSFQSSAHNMSSQMLAAARNIRGLKDDNSEEGRAERQAEYRKIGSIMAQQATFTGVRFLVGGMITYALVGAIREAWDDEEGAVAQAELELEKARKKYYPSKADKEMAIAMAERKLADAKSIRRAVINMKQQASGDALMKSMVRDQLQNLHIVGSVGDGLVPKVFMMVPNSLAQQSHIEAQDQIIKKLKKEKSDALAAGDRKRAAKIQESITDAQAVEFIPYFYSKRDSSGFGGIVGGMIDPIYTGIREGVEDITRDDKDFLTARAFVPDMITYMAALGLGQADVNRIARQLQRIDDELSKNREEANKRAGEKVDKLTNKPRNNFFIFDKLGENVDPPKTNIKIEIGQKVGGYRIASSKELGLDKFFKSRPEVAGMAWGGGANGSDPDEEKVVVHNPYNDDMKNERARYALYVLEAARHEMDKIPVGEYKISPELQKWREMTFEKGTPYRDDDKAFRETVVSRALIGDTGGNKKMEMPIKDVPLTEIEKYKHLLK